MTYQTPCRAENRDDWFISKDGKQYQDDELVSDQDVADHLNKVDPHGTRSEAEFVHVLGNLEAQALKDALRRRRHAKDACHTDCYFRLQCLGMALEDPAQAGHGTWGGYYEEELRELRKETARRKRARARQA
jgi:hypothetical protein